MIHHKKDITIAAFFLVLSALLQGAQALIIQPAMDDALLGGEENKVFLITGVIVLLGVVMGISKYIQTVRMNTMGSNVISHLQSDMMSSIINADISHMFKDGSSKMVARFISDTYQVREAVVKSITGIARDLVLVIVMIGVMIYQDWELTLVVFTIFPITALPIVAIGKKLRRIARTSQERVGDMTSLLDDKFKGVRLVKSFCAEEFAQEKARVIFDWIAKLGVKAIEVRSRMYPMMELLGGASVALLILYGSFKIAEGEASVGSIMSFMGALMMAYQPMRSLANLNSNLQQGLAAAQRSFEVIDIKPMIVEAPDASELQLNEGTIRFKDVSFSYDNEIEVLKGISLDIPAGSKVALVGPSGAGKSTIFNLLLRFYDTTKGSIEIDGQDISGLTFRSLRDNIALVSQETGIFNDTVLANIAYADTAPDREKAIAAAKAAEAHDFIMMLEDGYDSELGEMGTKLSGGQRQRLAIARAIYKDAPILLLDEATSALDSETEKLVQKALKRLIEGRTVLMIAHRLSTIVDSDVIYALQAGKVAESGTHTELLARNGLYAKLHAHQSENETSVS
ncbi:ABC transporter ATP-binding protein [Aestuariispira insulae]|nr:ABC transporter ATP-binding protein [Aestuariispira insulae]